MFIRVAAGGQFETFIKLAGWRHCGRSASRRKISTREYRARLFAQRYLGCMLLTVCILVPLSLAAARAIVPAVTVIAIVFLGLWRLYTRKMRISATSFLCDGWFTSFKVSRSDVDRVVSSGALGYPTDRLHGPAEYCVLTKDGKKHWVSLLFFDTTASKAFCEELVKIRHIRGALAD
jgi:hypothetical protein